MIDLFLKPALICLSKGQLPHFLLKAKGRWVLLMIEHDTDIRNDSYRHVAPAKDASLTAMKEIEKKVIFVISQKSIT